jgi:hypothetical protein
MSSETSSLRQSGQVLWEVKPQFSFRETGNVSVEEIRKWLCEETSSMVQGTTPHAAECKDVKAYFEKRWWYDFFEQLYIFLLPILPIIWIVSMLMPVRRRHWIITAGQRYFMAITESDDRRMGISGLYEMDAVWLGKATKGFSVVGLIGVISEAFTGRTTFLVNSDASEQQVAPGIFKPPFGAKTKIVGVSFVIHKSELDKSPFFRA